ncbi:DUF2914 domain-containing protein [Sorangium sp. So ce1036]|uniref:DUF2914 domain-containing protein n=1 Tax=Sorangium sp. So ce1036 TaxID=3133328 RepID=UPI003F05FF2D
MATNMGRWRMVLALCTVTLAGCSERHDTQPPAPAAVASPPPAPCSEPAAAAPAAPVPSPAATMAAPSPAATMAAPSPAARAAASTRSKGAKEGKKGKAELTVKRLVVAEGVENREPVEPGTTFSVPATERIYAFVELENRGESAGEVTVEFVPPDGGEPVGNVTLGVGVSPRWRTWAFTRGARKVGEWTALVRSETGEVLASAPFEVTL